MLPRVGQILQACISFLPDSGRVFVARCAIIVTDPPFMLRPSQHGWVKQSKHRQPKRVV